MKMLNSTVAVYHSHKQAVEAVKKLQNADFPVTQVSIIGRAEIEEDHVKVHQGEEVFETGVVIGSVLGTILGTLSGLSMIAVPGLGVLYAAGALVGSIGGFSLGAAGGTIFGALLSVGVGKEGVATYHKHLTDGKYLVVVHGNADQVKNAEDILKDGDHHELNVH